MHCVSRGVMPPSFVKSRGAERSRFFGGTGGMSRAIHAAIAMTGLACALWPAASLARHLPKRPVAEERFGLVNSRAPRIGPRVVRRGGYTALTNMIRPRFFGGMTDIYPSAAIGVRLSVGSRYFA